MKGLPVNHKTAQEFYDELCRAQKATLTSGLPQEDVIHRIEYIYDIKQEIACALVQLEKKLFSLRNRWDSDETDNVVSLR